MFNILHSILLIFPLALKQESQVGNLEFVPYFSLLSVTSKLQEMKGIATWMLPFCIFLNTENSSVFFLILSFFCYQHK